MTRVLFFQFVNSRRRVFFLIPLGIIWVKLAERSCAELKNLILFVARRRAATWQQGWFLQWKYEPKKRKKSKYAVLSWLNPRNNIKKFRPSRLYISELQHAQEYISPKPWNLYIHHINLLQWYIQSGGSYDFKVWPEDLRVTCGNITSVKSLVAHKIKKKWSPDME